MFLGAGSIHGRAFVDYALQALNVVVDNPHHGKHSVATPQMAMRSCMP